MKGVRAAEKLGPAAAALAVHCKGQEFPAHVPQAKRSLALIYAVNPLARTICHMTTTRTILPKPVLTRWRASQNSGY